MGLKPAWETPDPGREKAGGVRFVSFVSHFLETDFYYVAKVVFEVVIWTSASSGG